MTRASLFSTLALAASIVLIQRVALAQTPQLDALIHRGVEALRSDHYDEALQLFTQAWDQSHAPRARAQMGFAEQVLGQWLNSDAHLREALAATTDPWITAHRHAIETAISEVGEHLGTLTLRGGVPGAGVWVGTRQIAVLPMDHAASVVAGTVTYEVRAAGYAPLQRTVLVGAHEPVLDTIELVPALRATTPPPTASAVPATQVAPATPSVAPPSSPAMMIVMPPPPVREAPAETSGPPFVALGIVSAILAVGGIVGGVVALEIGLGYDAQFMQECPPPAGRPLDRCNAFMANAGQAQVGDLVGFIGGGVFGVAAIALLVAGATHSRRHALESFACAPSLGGSFGATCGLRF